MHSFSNLDFCRFIEEKGGVFYTEDQRVIFYIFEDFFIPIPKSTLLDVAFIFRTNENYFHLQKREIDSWLRENGIVS